MKEDKDLLPFKRPRKKIIDDDDIPLGAGKTAKGTRSKTTKKKPTVKKEKKDEPKRHTFFVNPVLLEQLKDLVFTRKYTKGEVHVNQSTVINEAIEKLIREYKGEIQARPKYIRDIEEKKAKRPNKKNS